MAFNSIPLQLPQVSLAAVLRCGQSFRWSILVANDPDSVEYRFCLKDRVICLRQSPDTLYYRAVFPDPQPSPANLCEREKETLGWLTDYFQLNVDLVTLYQGWAARDKVFANFQGRFEGIRILRQDPWENLVSFICSSNNNISRITKMVQHLCTHYSPPLLSLPHPFNPTEILTYHPFPPPSALATSGVAQRLRSLGFGYRAEYIQRTAQMLVEAHGTQISGLFEESELWLRDLRHWSTSDARQELLKFVGVGRKVADCILLMSLDKKEVVPVDTHVHQIAVKHYGMRGTSGKKAALSPKLYEQANAKFFSMWGEYAGWAHTVLFTADLKSFASYGLQTPRPTPPLASPHNHGSRRNPTADVTTLATPPKRRRDPEFETDGNSYPELSEPISSLADRVKRRRTKPS